MTPEPPQGEPASRTGLDTAVRWLSRRGTRWATATLVAVAIALISATQLYVNWRSQGFPAAFPRILVTELVEWMSWAAFLPAIVAIDRRMGFGRAGAWARALSLHVGMAVAWFAAQNCAMVFLGKLSEGGGAGAPGFGTLYLDRFMVKLPSALLVYALLLAGIWVAHLYRAYYRRSVESERLAVQLTRARFENLSAQMRPHFLFNSLHTVAGLVREGDREQAIETLATLSSLLRRSLDMADEQEVALSEELELLDGYLRIQHARFGDRLRVDREIDPAILATRVPTLFLQPLVENAIRHGLELDRETGRVSVRGRRSDGHLVFEVSDNGRGFDPELAGDTAGVGLRNTRERLEQLYGDDAALDVETAPGAGTRVRISLPDRGSDRPITMAPF